MIDKQLLTEILRSYLDDNGFPAGIAAAWYGMNGTVMYDSVSVVIKGFLNPTDCKLTLAFGDRLIADADVIVAVD